MARAMHRRQRRLACAIAAAVASGATLPACDGSSQPVDSGARATPATRVLLVTLDTVRWDRVGCYGDPRGLTPNVDALALQGARFVRVTAPMPETAPSHAAMLSGRSPFSHGLINHFLGMSRDVETVPEILSRAGVATGAFHHVFPFAEFQLLQGFDKRVRDRGVDALEVGPALLSWLDSLPRDQPAFGWLHLYLAHTPFTPPEDLRRRFVTHPYARELQSASDTLMRLHAYPQAQPPGYAEAFSQLYDADVAYCDRRFGEILDGLRERAGFDDLLLIVTSDHGESLGPVPGEGTPEKPARGMFGMHAFDVREGTMRVPLVMRGPGVPAGSSIEPRVRLVDLAPTILEAFDLGPPAECEGTSLWPYLRNEPVEPPPAWGSMPINNQELAADELPGLLVHWNGRFKLVVERIVPDATEPPAAAGERMRLYDVEADPEQLRDLAAEHPEVVKQMRNALDALIERAQAGREEPGELTNEGRLWMKQLGYVE